MEGKIVRLLIFINFLMSIMLDLLLKALNVNTTRFGNIFDGFNLPTVFNAFLWDTSISLHVNGIVPLHNPMKRDFFWN
jgi:hypothetical protein